MDDTPNLKLPYIMAAQAQKHVTHNEAVRALDALVQLGVLDRDLTAPPASPADGARYIVASGASGAWVGQAGKVAAWQDGAWAFYAAQQGWTARVADEDKTYVYDGTAWAALPASGTSLQNVPMLGINATADTTNRLAVKSAASLFDNAGAGHQHKINKAAAGDTASLMFQTGYSGRAEMGLAGDDNFHLKVSADGTTWKEAVVVDKTTGKVGLGTSAPPAKLTVSDNTAALPAGLAGTLLQLASADAVATRLLLDGFGASVLINFRRANGTAASPSALTVGAGMGAFNWLGYGTTGYTTSNRAEISCVAAENWTNSAQGTDLLFKTNPKGAAAASVERMRVTSEGLVSVGAITAVCKLDVDGPARVKSYTVATVPAANAGAGQIIYVSDESGGAVPAFSDGTNWRRVTDRAVVS